MDRCATLGDSLKLTDTTNEPSKRTSEERQR